jgi:WD40 repeat protein
MTPAFPAGTPPHPVIEALEMLTRAWNPAHMPPRAIRAMQADEPLAFPAQAMALPWSGSHLRGLRIEAGTAMKALAHCDLHGCEAPPGAQPDPRFGLLAAVRTAMSEGGTLPSLSAPPRAAWPGHRAAIHCLAISPDGTRVATAGAQGRLSLWALRDSGVSEVVALRAGRKSLNDVAFSPDGQRIAAAGDDGQLRVWSVGADGGPDAPEPIAAFDTQQGRVNSVAFSSPHALATGGQDGRVKLWMLEDGNAREFAPFESHRSHVLSVAFSPQGRVIASASVSGPPRLWTVEDARVRELAAPDLRGGVLSRVGFDGSGALLAAVGSKDGAGALWLWTFDGTALREIVVVSVRDTGSFIDLVFAPDRRLLGVVDDDGSVRLWGLDGTETRELTRIEGASASRMAFDPTGSCILTAGDDGVLRAWALHVVGARQRPQVLHAAGARQFAAVGGGVSIPSCALFGAGGRHMLSGHDDGTLHLWSSQDIDARELAVVSGHGGSAITALAFSADGQRVASAGRDLGVRVWQVQDRGLREGVSSQLQGPLATSTMAMAFTPDGTRLLTVDGDGVAMARSALSMTAGPTPLLDPPAGLLRAATFNADARLLAAADDAGRLRVWLVGETSAVTLATSPDNAARDIVSLVFSPDNRQLATGSEDGSVRLWAIDERELHETTRLTAHAAPVRSLAFSPGGQSLATGDDDGVVRRWSLDTAQPRELAKVDAHDGAVSHLAFSDDGTRLLSTGADGCVRLALPDNAAWRAIGKGLVVIEHVPGDIRWTLARADGQPFDTVQRGGATLPADRLLYEWLWFSDPAWGSAPAFEVPPEWLQWSDDRRTLTLSRTAHAPEELQQWAQVMAPPPP